MATKQARCANFGGCQRADAKDVWQVADGADVVCPECRSAVVLLPAHAPAGARRVVAAALGVAVLAVAGGVTWKLVRREPPGAAPVQVAQAATLATLAVPGDARRPSYDLVLAGSNTIGGVDADSQTGLGRALVYGFLKATWPAGSFAPDRLIPIKDKEENEREITYEIPGRAAIRVLIQPHGSGTMAAALTRSELRADIGMASAPRDDVPAGYREVVVALDAVAVIVHPDNPRDEVTLAELAQMFGPSPTLTRW